MSISTVEIVCLLVLATFDIRSVFGFYTIDFIRVCELGVSVRVGKAPDGYVAPDFTGVYERSPRPNQGIQPTNQYLPLTREDDGDFEFRFSPRRPQYLWRHRPDPTNITNIDLVDDLRGNIFRHFWDYGNGNPGGLGCDCTNEILDNPNDSPAVRFQNRDNENLETEITGFRACATWVEIDHEDDRDNEPDFLSPDHWACRENDCDILLELLDTGYHGFEVFSDPRCTLAEQLNNGDWMCCNCATGFHRFPRFEATKCRGCQEYFGNNCLLCQDEMGCVICDTSAGYQLNVKAGECQIQWCSLEGETEDDHDGCCETDDDSLESIDSTTDDCVEDVAEDDDGGSSVADLEFVCNLADFDFDTWNTETNGRFALGDVTENCDNPYPRANNNFCAFFDVDDSCDICQCSDTDQASGLTCDVDDNIYFGYSDAMECVKCTRDNVNEVGFSNCLNCANGVGCVQCEENYSLVFDHTYGVWYCVDGPNDAAGYVFSGANDWNGQCFTECVSTRGKMGFCNCGCDCDDRDECADSALFDPFHCQECYYDAGCVSCDDDNGNNPSNDWFLITKFHPCHNCQDTFGDQCLFCNDNVGCGQCAPGYLATFDTCCQMVYCERIGESSSSSSE